MNITVGGLVWIRKDQAGRAVVEDLRRKLTFKRRVYKDFKGAEPSPIVKLYDETEYHIGVPRRFWADTSKSDHKYSMKLSFGHPITTTTSIMKHEGVYAEQATIIDFFVDRFQRASAAFRAMGRGEDADIPMVEALRLSGGILLAKPGAGKSNIAIDIIHRLGTTALVLVHKEFLMRQWKERVEKFLPGARVGIIQEDTCDYLGKDVVIGMVHSLSRDDMDGERYPVEIYRHFGILIADEVHHIGSEVWQKLPMRFSAACRLGLSATPRRKDGADRVFFDHIGPVTYTAKTKMETAGVRVSRYTGWVPDFIRDENVKSPTVINQLVRIKDRTRKTVQEVLAALNVPGGRKVMVLSHRLEHLEAIEETILRSRYCPKGLTVGHYTGEWFGPGDSPVLKPGHWDMNEEGRKKAISVVYSSVSRRAGGLGCIEKTSWVDPWTAETVEGKGHIVAVDTSIVQSWLIEDGLSEFSSLVEGEEVFEVVLEELTDDHIFDIAEKMYIRQERKRKKVEVKPEELFEAERARLIMATFQMVEEGLDIPPIDTICLSTPMGDVEQSEGRGRRFCIPERLGGVRTPAECEHFCPWRAEKCKGKNPLVVIDLLDVGVPMSEKRWRYRARHYKDEGYKVSLR